MANDLIERDPFDPKKIYNELIKRCKQAKEWYIYCLVDEEWIPKKSPPFDLVILNGIFCCRVISTTHKQAVKIVSDTLPVIRFIDEPREL
jgi:hypothetical protein